MMYEPSFTKLHSMKKEMQLFQLSYVVNFCYFTCTQTSEYCERTMNQKVYLIILFPKRNTTFHAFHHAFLLRLSVMHYTWA